MEANGIEEQRKERVTGDAVIIDNNKNTSRSRTYAQALTLIHFIHLVFRFVSNSDGVMQRLADYFLVVGYDHDEERAGRSCGKIIQRFPEKDWPDCPFNPRVIHFCQPQGWTLSAKHELPTFFISILTDLDGFRHYCACLTFHQTLLPATSTLNKNNACGDEADDTAFRFPRTQMYAPKCLVLTSKLDCFEAFRVRIQFLFFNLSTEHV